jgi:hypothetical protein
VLTASGLILDSDISPAHRCPNEPQYDRHRLAGENHVHDARSLRRRTLGLDFEVGGVGDLAAAQPEHSQAGRPAAAAARTARASSTSTWAWGASTRYQPGRRDWVKVKTRATVEVIIGAVTGSLQRPKVVVAGRYRGAELEMVGRTVLPVIGRPPRRPRPG